MLKQYQDLLTQLPHAAGAPECPCPSCDQVFDTPMGRRTHIGKMHPGTVDRFVPSTFRQEHAVSGLPQCAACLRHFSKTTCCQERAQSRPNFGNWSVHRMNASTSGGGGTALHPRQQMLRDTAQTHTALAVGRLDLAQDFMAYCALCGFWTVDHTKIKSHIRQAHREQWSRHGNAATEACKRAGIPLIKGQPCPCCRKLVHDRKGHASQCAVLFQILFYDLTHGLQRTKKHLLDAHFTAVPRQEIAAHAPPRTTLLADPSVPSGTSREESSAPRPLLNPSNYCYVNALLSALVPTGILSGASASATALHKELLKTGNTRPHNVVASFALRTLTPRWRFDGQQQDTSEFLLALFRGLSAMPITRSWAKRDLITGEHLDGGGPLILLPAPEAPSRLQSLINSWHSEKRDVALTGTQPFVVLQAARFTDRSKLSYSLSGLHFALNLPTWEGHTVEWRAGWVQACVFHIGDSPHRGHYRTLWRRARHEGWLFTDDGRSSITASESDMRQSRHTEGRGWPTHN